MATAKSTESKVPQPPYGSFKSFRAFVDTLHSTVLPDEIDRSMMTKMSGVTQTELLSALRFFGLIGPGDAVTKGMRELVDSFGTDEWPKQLARVVRSAYSAIIGDLNIKTATAQQFSNRFKENAGIDGFALSKSLRFYLAALKEAGMPFSPLFKVKDPSAKRNTNGSSKTNPEPPAKEAGRRKAPTVGGSIPEIIPGCKRYPLFFKGKPEGALFVPEDLTTADATVIELTLAVVKAYAAQQSQVSDGSG